MARKQNNEKTDSLESINKIKDAESTPITKDSLISELIEASSKSSGFSVKSLDRSKSKKTEQKTSKVSLFANDDDYNTFPNIDEEEWEKMLTAFEELSPIDDITDEERSYYRKKSDGDKYDDMFKKERSMLSEVLSDIQKRSKLINNKIVALSSKGTYGISKNFVELVESSNAIDDNKMKAIKALVDVKKTIVDLRLKDQKANPTINDEMDNDTIADKFYRSIVTGDNRSQFINNSMGELDTSSPNIIRQYDEQGNSMGVNLSQPLNLDDDYDNDIESADKYGYIRNENRDIDICVQRFSTDGRMCFVAIDGDGNFLDRDEYEIPDDNIIDETSIRPGSSYIYDIYKRRYKIIDVDTGYASLDDD